jgi:formylglycine-generating enzyme required for sulfatase activity
MAAFDPYHIWLGIPPEDQPPSHYRLLAIPELESDPDVIDGAADQRTIYLRTFQAGDQAQLAEQLLNEVSAARVCLLDGKAKTSYDQRLKAELESAAGSVALANISLAVESGSQRDRGRRTGSSAPPAWYQTPWAAAGGGAVVMLLLILLFWPGGSKPPANKSTNTTPGNRQKTQPTASNETLPAKVAVAPPLAVAPFDAAQAKAHQQAWSKYLGVPVEYTNSIGMKLTLIPAGEFQMGSPDSDSAALDREKPQHLVKITKPFYLAVHEVTQQQYEKVMEARPWQGKTWVKEGPDYPASYVSHDHAVEFCRRLSKQEGVEYRLPTEAEWEYACRAGTTTAYSFGDDEAKLGQYAWYGKNAWDVGEEYAHRVGQKLPNRWGLYDMHGNAWEWCQDWWGPYGSEKVVSDPLGPAQGYGRVLRGGSFNARTSYVRSANRNINHPDPRNYGFGFRAARTYNLSP